MTAREDVESYLLRMEVDVQEVDEGMWVLKSGEEGASVVLHYSPPVVVLRLKVLDLPAGAGDGRLAPLYRRLLELNAADILHGSYGIEANEVVLSDALELEDLDFAELRSSYESLTFAASSHLPALAALVDETAAGAHAVQQG